MDPLLVGSIVTFGKKLINKVWPDPEKQAEASRKLLELQQTGELKTLEAEMKVALAQLDINKAEAMSEKLFKSGWRPFVGWICGFGLAYVAIIEPIARFIAQVGFGYTGLFPQIDTSLTMQVLLGLLGLSGFRTFEKYKRGKKS